MNVLQQLQHCTLQNFGNNFFDDVYYILKRTHLENFFHHINNFHQNIKFSMEEKSNGELALLDTLLKRNNGEISELVYTKPTHTDQYLHYSSHHQTRCKDSVVSSLFNRAYFIITNKDGSHRENARIRQVLKENRYQESIISKIFKGITSNHSLFQSQQLTQATDNPHVNINGFLPKIDELRDVAISSNTTVIGSSESKLNLFFNRKSK